MYKFSANNYDDDEDKTDEHQALIDDEELNSSQDFDLLQLSDQGRQLQQARKRQLNNSASSSCNLELKTIKTDLISEPFVEFTFYDIQPGDTLHSICLKYACSVNQVKRLNSLINDQDFYGLRRLKLPLGKLALLKDVISSERAQSVNGPFPYSRGDTISKFPVKQTNVTFPGSALPVNRHIIGSNSSSHYSSDNLNSLSTNTAEYQQQIASTSNGLLSNNSFRSQHFHSHSFSSLREFSQNDTKGDINIDLTINPNTNRMPQQHQAFIKPDFNVGEQIYEDHFDIQSDNLEEGGDRVTRVFQDLDMHVERAKVAAELYPHKAAEIVKDLSSDKNSLPSGNRLPRRNVSMIPELFLCNENFGLSYKKLLFFVFAICILTPLILFVNQASI